MSILLEHLDFCKNQAAYHERVAADPKIKPHQKKKHAEAAKRLSELAAFLSALQENEPEKQPPASADIFELDPFRLDDIPDELVEELKISRADKADAQILELLRIAKRPLNISEILIGLYRKFNESEKRTAVSARLYRLSQAGEIEPVEGERGVYQLSEKAKPAF